MPAKRGEPRKQLNAWVKPNTAEYIKFLAISLSLNLGQVFDLLASEHQDRTFNGD